MICCLCRGEGVVVEMWGNDPQTEREVVCPDCKGTGVV